MNIISFATEESDWKTPRIGIILSHAGRDTGYRLDCERLFDPADHPSNPLSWFDMDGPWFQKAREVFDGFARKPPVFLKPGDEMEVLIEGMEGLGNPVIGQ